MAHDLWFTSALMWFVRRNHRTGWRKNQCMPKRRIRFCWMVPDTVALSEPEVYERGFPPKRDFFPMLLNAFFSRLIKSNAMRRLSQKAAATEIGKQDVLMIEVFRQNPSGVPDRKRRQPWRNYQLGINPPSTLVAYSTLSNLSIRYWRYELKSCTLCRSRCVSYGHCNQYTRSSSTSRLCCPCHYSSSYTTKSTSIGFQQLDGVYGNQHGLHLAHDLFS